MKKNRSIYNSIVANVKHDLENCESTSNDFLKNFAMENPKATFEDSGLERFGSVELYHCTVKLKMQSSSIELFTLLSKNKIPHFVVASWLNNTKTVEKDVIFTNGKPMQK